MAALKKLQAEKDSGEWESLSEQAREQVSMNTPCISVTYSGPRVPKVAHGASLRVLHFCRSSGPLPSCFEAESALVQLSHRLRKYNSKYNTRFDRKGLC